MLNFIQPSVLTHHGLQVRAQMGNSRMNVTQHKKARGYETSSFQRLSGGICVREQAFCAGLPRLVKSAFVMQNENPKTQKDSAGNAINAPRINRRLKLGRRQKTDQCGGGPTGQKLYRKGPGGVVGICV